jgi:hypothetical protein
MAKQDARRLWIVPVLLALAVLACSGSPEPTATPLPRPTQKPNATATTQAPAATATKASAKPTATNRPAQTTEEATQEATQEATSGAAPFKLSDTPYTHKSGAFTITLPDGWKVDEQDNSVFVDAPDSVSSIDVSFTNVGVEFDEETLNTYIHAEEDNWFGSFNDYTPRDFEKQSDGSIGVYKNLTLSGGTPETVFSYYWQKGTVVYEQDFWVDADQYEQYVDGLVDVANSMTTDPDAGALVDAYAVVYQFTDSTNLFQFLIPYGWTHENSTDTNTNIETFTEPGKRSYVENIAYDDGKPISKSDAGRFARSLLTQYYEVNDLKVTDDQVQSDGSERLTWTSASKGVDGESFFESRGTTFLLLTWVVNTDDYDFFKPVWKALVDSYGVPQP